MAEVRSAAASGPEPAVSVIAIGYNHAPFLVAALEGIRAQTFRDFELIVADDASTDESVPLMRSWLAEHAPEATLIAHERNAGLCRTLNEALGLARGRFIAMCALDDVWMPEKLERQVAQLSSLPERVGVLYSDAYQMDERGNRLPKRFIEAHLIGQTRLEGKIFDSLVVRNWIPVPTVLIRRSCYDVVGLYDERLVYEDYDMWLRMSRHFEFVLSPYVSASFRLRDASLMQQLFGKRRAELLLSESRIRAKTIDTGALDAATRRRLGEDIVKFSRQLYLGGDPAAAIAARLAAKRGRIGAIPVLIALRIHLSPAWWRRISWLRRPRKLLRQVGGWLRRRLSLPRPSPRP